MKSSICPQRRSNSSNYNRTKGAVDYVTQTCILLHKCRSVSYRNSTIDSFLGVSIRYMIMVRSTSIQVADLEMSPFLFNQKLGQFLSQDQGSQDQAAENWALSRVICTSCKYFVSRSTIATENTCHPLR